MKKLVMPDKLPKYLDQPIKEAIQISYGFLCSRYGYKFDNVNLVLQPTANRSRYFNNKGNQHAKFGGEPVATISLRNTLMLYRFKSLGEYVECIKVDYTTQIACAIVHELTHHVQFLEGRSASELETTRNELDLLKLSFPEWYKRIKFKTI